MHTVSNTRMVTGNSGTGHTDSGRATADATQRRSIDVALRHANFRIYHTAFCTPRGRMGEGGRQGYSSCPLTLNEYECSASRPGSLPYGTEPLCGHQSGSARFSEESNPLSCRRFAECSTALHKLTIPQLVKK